MGNLGGCADKEILDYAHPTKGMSIALTTEKLWRSCAQKLASIVSWRQIYVFVQQIKAKKFVERIIKILKWECKDGFRAKKTRSLKSVASRFQSNTHFLEFGTF